MQSHCTCTIDNITKLSLVLALAPMMLTSTATANDREAAFKARCGECHGPRDIQFWGRQRPDAAARQVWLDQFLRRHYPPSEAERDLIIGYIQVRIAGATAPR